MEGWLLCFMVANSLGLLLSVISGPLTDPLYLIETGLRVVILVGIGFQQRWGYYGWLAYAGAAIFSILSVILVDPSFAFEWTPGSFGGPIVLELLVTVAWSSYFLFSYRVYSYLLATTSNAVRSSRIWARRRSDLGSTKNVKPAARFLLSLQ